MEPRAVWTSHWLILEHYTEFYLPAGCRVEYLSEEIQDTTNIPVQVIIPCQKLRQETVYLLLGLGGTLNALRSC